MSALVRRRSGHLEYLCATCSRWYWRLASHLRRFHGWDHGPEPTRVFNGYHTKACKCGKKTA